jgi:asparagine synthase (glutamine-hydrolysing)
MFFSVLLGTRLEVFRWCEAVRAHAQWLELTAHIDARPLAHGGQLAVAWLTQDRMDASCPLADPADTLWTSTLHGDLGSNAVSLSWLTDRSELRATVPAASPQQLYYARLPGGHVIADDLRLFPRLMVTTLDERAIYALLQYGAIPAPLTIWREVQRIPGGHLFRVPAGERAPVAEPAFPITGVDAPDNAHWAPEARVGAALDEVLARVPHAAVLYFSGGVDSGLLAARLVRAGRRDIRLINFAFGPDDRESQLALRMAAHFGLDCQRLEYSATGVARVLQRIGRDYSFPFGDVSVIPTNILVHESLPLATASGTVIEGTGADGAFGIAERYPLWRSIYRLPMVIRQRARRMYAARRLWEDDSRLERLARFVRKSAVMSLDHAVVAQNALDELAYPVPVGAPATLAAGIREVIEAVANPSDARARLSLVDLTWVCAGRMAPKSLDPLRSRGVRALYPFLEPGMLQLSASLSWREKCPHGQAKAILKRLLAADVPNDWVYRPKSGFTPPYRAMFASTPMQELLHDLVWGHEPLLAFCDGDTVRDLIHRTRHSPTLSSGVYEFLWALAFTAAWLTQLPSRAPVPYAGAYIEELEPR